MSLGSLHFKWMGFDVDQIALSLFVFDVAGLQHFPLAWPFFKNMENADET